MDESWDLFFFIKLRDSGCEKVIEWCQAQGLISPFYLCPKCGRRMRLIRSKKLRDEFVWVCRGHSRDHETKRSVRKGSCFEKSKLSIGNILLITYMVIKGCSHQFISNELKLASNTISDWGNFVRQVCRIVVLEEGGMLGGPGKVVEVDETKFGNRILNRGSIAHGRWVFGGIERGSGKCFLNVVNSRSSKTLLPIIQQHVLPGTTIITDEWKGYKELADWGYEHQTVDQKFCFKDPKSGAHTNTIKGSWTAIKTKLPKNIGQGQFESYLGFYMWSKKHREEEKIVRFLNDIRKIFPPQTQDENSNVTIQKNIPIQKSDAVLNEVKKQIIDPSKSQNGDLKDVQLQRNNQPRMLTKEETTDPPQMHYEDLNYTKNQKRKKLVQGNEMTLSWNDKGKANKNQIAVLGKVEEDLKEADLPETVEEDDMPERSDQSSIQVEDLNVVETEVIPEHVYQFLQYFI